MDGWIDGLMDGWIYQSIYKVYSCIILVNVIRCSYFSLAFYSLQYI